MTKPTDIVAPDVYGKIDGEDVTDAVMFKIYITYVETSCNLRKLPLFL